MSDESRDVNRKNRSIRFNDYEWDVIKNAADRAGKTPGAFVHDAALEHATREDLSALSKEMRGLITELRARLHELNLKISDSLD